MAPINRVRELREIARKKIEAKKREEELEKKDKEIDADGLTLQELKRLSPFTGGKDGKGRYYTRWYDSGSRYVGEWKEEPTWQNRKIKWNNKHRTPHGLGKLYLRLAKKCYSNEDNEHLLYIGEWDNGEFHGNGTYYWYSGVQAGNHYKGQFRRGKKHGFGHVYIANEDVPIECVYFNDRRIALWSDLYEGRRVQIRFAAYSGVGTDAYEGTIVKFEPNRLDNKKHLVAFDNDKPGYKSRWVDLTKMDFKLVENSKTSFYKWETFLPEITTPYLSCKTDPLHNRVHRFKDRAIKYYYTNPTPLELRFGNEDCDVERGELYDSDKMWGSKLIGDKEEEKQPVIDDMLKRLEPIKNRLQSYSSDTVSYKVFQTFSSP